MRKLIIPAVMAAAAFAATAPASAQSWQVRPAVQRQIQGDIFQLDRQIGRAQQNRAISPREAAGLRRDALNLQRQYNFFARNGLDRREVAQLQRSIERLHQSLKFEKRDRDGRRF